MVTFKKGWNHINFQNVISWSNFYQISKSQWVLDSIFPELQDSHITFSNSLRFDRFMKGFNNPVKSSNLGISITFFENVITWSNLGQILKSLVVLESSCSQLSETGIESWIWLSLRGFMKDWSRVISYQARICIWSTSPIP